jgi:hypothetical protein
MTNSIRPGVSGEPAEEWRSLELPRGNKPVALKGQRVKAAAGVRKVVGDGMVWKAMHMNQGDLAGGREPVRSQSVHSSLEAG